MKPRLPEGGYLNLAVARDQAVKKLASYNPKIVSRNAAVTFQEQEGFFTVPFLNQSYRVSHPGGGDHRYRGRRDPGLSLYYHPALPSYR